MGNIEARAQLMSQIGDRCDSLSFLARESLGREDNRVTEKEDGDWTEYSFGEGTLAFGKGVEAISFSRNFLSSEQRLVLLIRLCFRDGSTFLITDAIHKRSVTSLDPTLVGEGKEDEENLSVVQELAARLQELSPYKTLLEAVGQVGI